MIVAEDVVVKRGRIPSFYKDVDCEVPPQLTEFRSHYARSYVRGRRANAEDIPRILEVAARDIWKVPSSYTVMLEQRAKDHYVNNVRTIASNFCPTTYRAVYEALDIIQKADLPLAETVHGRMLFENIVFQLDGQPVFVNPIDPCQVYTPALDRGSLLQSYVMRWDEWRASEVLPVKPREWPAWADAVDWAFLVSAWTRMLPEWKDEQDGIRITCGLQILSAIKPC